MSVRKAEQRLKRTLQLAQRVAITEGEDGPYFTVAYAPKRSPDDEPYRVLLGASLAVPEQPGVRCVAVTAGSVEFPCVSSETVLGPPYVMAVACTCPDWIARSGLALFPAALSAKFPVKDAQRRDASAGCKHMMRCNEAMLQRAPVSISAAPDRPSKPLEPASDAYALRGKLPGHLARDLEQARRNRNKDYVQTEVRDDDSDFITL